MPVVSLWMLSSPLSAQTGAAPAAQPFNCRDATSRMIGFMMGEYSVRAVFRAGAAAWDSSIAVVTITPDLGGCVLREHFRGTRYGAPYESVALWGVHGDSVSPVQRTFVHSQHGLLSISQGQIVADTVILEDSAFVRGKWIYQRTLVWRDQNRELRNEGRRSEDMRATWFVTQRFHFKPRVKTS